MINFAIGFKTECPCCKKIITTIYPLSGDPPQDGDLTMCDFCYTPLMMVADDLSLRTPTREEFIYNMEEYQKRTIWLKEQQGIATQ